MGEAVGDFIADDGAEFCVGLFFLFAVADAAEVEVRAIADVALVVTGPADKAVIAVIAVFWVHGRRKCLAS